MRIDLKVERSTTEFRSLFARRLRMIDSERNGIPHLEEEEMLTQSKGTHAIRKVIRSSLVPLVLAWGAMLLVAGGTSVSCDTDKPRLGTETVFSSLTPSNRSEDTQSDLLRVQKARIVMTLSQVSQSLSELVSGNTHASPLIASVLCSHLLEPAAATSVAEFTASSMVQHSTSPYFTPEGDVAGYYFIFVPTEGCSFQPSDAVSPTDDRLSCFATIETSCRLDLPPVVSFWRGLPPHYSHRQLALASIQAAFRETPLDPMPTVVSAGPLAKFLHFRLDGPKDVYVDTSSLRILRSMKTVETASERAMRVHAEREHLRRMATKQQWDAVLAGRP